MTQLLMTNPANFSTQFEINPWMIGQVGKTDSHALVQQWSELRNALVLAGADVIVLPKSPEYCPDAVFTAAAGIVYKNTFIASRFKHEERASEETFFTNWFMEHKFGTMLQMPSGDQRATFEGNADVIFDKTNNSAWYGIGPRSSYSYKALLDRVFEESEFIVRGLELVDPKFFNLSTCFCPLPGGGVMWYPPAFSEHSQQLIKLWYKDKSLTISTEDANLMSCSSIVIGEKIITPKLTPFLKSRLKSRGIDIMEVHVGEFIKNGGGCKCLALEIIE